MVTLSIEHLAAEIERVQAFMQKQLEKQRRTVSDGLEKDKDIDNAAIEMLILERSITVCDRLDLAVHLLYLDTPNVAS